MRSSNKCYVALVAILFSLCGLISSRSYAAEEYHNIFISYSSPSNVASVAHYVRDQKLGGLMMWELRGDAPYVQKDSLLASIRSVYGADHPPVLAYWTDWSVYSEGTAIPQPAYAVPGSQTSGGELVKNQQFLDQLKGLHTVAYAFLEAQSRHYTYNGETVVNNYYDQDGGTLYFSDPWADLEAADAHCGAYQSSSPMSKICWFAYYNRDNKTTDVKDLAKMGNFDAFAKLPEVKKIISVGGYGYDTTFEDAFNNEKHIDNFVNSAVEIIKNFNVDGIDLDYENTVMTHEQSAQYAKLISHLRVALDQHFPSAKKSIDVTLLANPAYLSGTAGAKGDVGFTASALVSIAKDASSINLMSYDFHGAFDYNSADPDNSRTGFLTNLKLPTQNLPSGYNPHFSVEQSVDALLAVIGKENADKVVVGVPAYGRALTQVSNVNQGLYQMISPGEAIMPRGDLDDVSCNTSVPLVATNACSGSFTYHYIVEHMLTEGFTPKRWQESGVDNGTTAYAESWAPHHSQGYQLELSNTAQASNPNGAHTVLMTVADSAGNSLETPALSPLPSDNNSVTYAPSETKSLLDKNVTVHWRSDDGSNLTGVCPDGTGSFEFSANSHVMIAVYGPGDNAKLPGSVVCLVAH